MLFVLDPSLDQIALDPNHPQRAKFVDEMNALARARNAGRCLVHLDSPLLYKGLSSMPELSAQTKSIFSFLNRQRSFKADIVTKVAIAVRITSSGVDVSRVTKNNRQEIVIPLQFIPYDLFNSPVLLAENLSDAKAYLIFTHIALAAGVRGLPPVNLKSDLRGGGGSAIAAEYVAAKAQEDRLILCILDSDVRYPGCPSNAWSQAIREHDIHIPSVFASSEVIDVYSIENLFPLASLLELEPYKSDQNAAYALRRDLPILDTHAKGSYWRYIRLKEGVTCHDLRDRGELGTFWSGHEHVFANFSSKDCGTPLRTCKHKCARNPKLRDDTLQAFVKRYEKSTPAELRGLYCSIPEYVVSHFDHLARVIASWMCFGKPVTGVVAA